MGSGSPSGGKVCSLNGCLGHGMGILFCGDPFYFGFF